MSTTEEKWMHLMAEARNPTTPSERLRILYEQGQDEFGERIYKLDEALTEHPSTPPDVLRELVPKHPIAFVRNPVSLLLPLEDPAFVDLLRRAADEGLLRSAHAPRWLVELVILDSPDPILVEDARQHIVLVPPLPLNDIADETLRALKRLAEPEMLARMTENEVALLCELTELGIAPAWIAQHAAARLESRQKTPTQSLFRGLTSPQLQKQQEEDYQTAINPETPARVLLKLAQVGEPETRLAVAQHPNTSLSTLQLLAQSNYRDGKIRCAIASNPKADAPLLSRLIADGAAPVRRAARANPGATDKIIARQHPAALTAALNLNGPALCRFFALLHPEAKQDTIVTATTRSIRWPERLAAAYRLTTPPIKEEARVLNTLATDGNRLIRTVTEARHSGKWSAALDSEFRMKLGLSTM